MTAVDTLKRPAGTRPVKYPVGVKRGQPRRQVLPVPGFVLAPNSFDILLRHRPRSISRWPKVLQRWRSGTASRDAKERKNSSPEHDAPTSPRLSPRNPRPVALLLGDRLAGAAQLFGEVLELGEAIFHAQHGRLVIDVHLRCKRKCRDRRRVDVDQTPLRVPRQKMAAADLAPLPVAPLVLVVLADLVFSLGHLDRLGLPERECVDRGGRPAPAGGAMAVASALRIACDDNRDGAAEALPFEGLFVLAHEFSLRSRSRCDIAHSVSRSKRRFSCERAGIKPRTPVRDHLQKRRPRPAR